MISNKWQTLIKVGWDLNRLLFRLLHEVRGNGIGVIYLEVIRYYKEDHGHYTEYKQSLKEVTPLLDLWRWNGSFGMMDYVIGETGIFLLNALPDDKDVALQAEQLRKEIQRELMLRQNQMVEVYLGCSIIHKEQLVSNGFLFDMVSRAFIEARNERDYIEEEKRARLIHRISDNKLVVRYQPIYSLKTGTLFAYESTVQGQPEDVQSNHLSFFAVERSLLDHIKQERQLKICLQIDIHILRNLEFFFQELRELLEASQTEPRSVVLEIPLSNVTCEDWERIREAVHFYKRQGFCVCLNQVHPDYRGWKMIDGVNPHFLKVDRSLIHDCHTDWIKEEMLRWIISNSKRMNSQLIATGVDTVEEYQKVVQLGFDFAQGDFLGQLGQAMAAKDSLLEFSVPKEVVYFEERRLKEGIPKEIVKVAKVVQSWTLVSEISGYFEQSNGESYVIVTNGRDPIGLISKNKLYQRLGTRYGISLYMNKRVIEVMDPEPLIVEHISLEEVSQLAMSRDPDRLYDAIIVMEMGRIMGIVTIQSLLDTITKLQIEQAKDANSLTHLPGVNGIESEIRRRMNQKEDLSIIYADLDRFKWFNDQFGFKKGDLVIGFLARLLIDLQKQKACRFTGHIGGDDFMVITSQADAENLCRQVIESFDTGIQAYYPETIIRELEGKGRIDIIDRDGEIVKCKGLSISLSIFDCDPLQYSDLSSISPQVAELKRAAKAITGSTYVRGKGCLASVPSQL